MIQPFLASVQHYLLNSWLLVYKSFCGFVGTVEGFLLILGTHCCSMDLCTSSRNWRDKWEKAKKDGEKTDEIQTCLVSEQRSSDMFREKSINFIAVIVFCCYCIFLLLLLPLYYFSAIIRCITSSTTRGLDYFPFM